MTFCSYVLWCVMYGCAWFLRVEMFVPQLFVVPDRLTRTFRRGTSQGSRISVQVSGWDGLVGFVFEEI